jgi:hypothetical protein
LCPGGELCAGAHERVFGGRHRRTCIER